jgi:hypothetical protein
MTTTTQPLIPKSFSTPLMLIGPVATVLLVAHMAGSHYLPHVAVIPALLVAVALWSPSPISIPALVMQDVRDSYGAQMRGLIGTLKRGVLITFWMASKRSGVRAEMLASLVGFSLAGILALVLR